MKDYVNQFYNEGLATTFHLKPVNWIRKKVRNKKVSKCLVFLIKVLYTILVLIFALFIFLIKWPL